VIRVRHDVLVSSSQRKVNGARPGNDVEPSQGVGPVG